METPLPYEYPVWVLAISCIALFLISLEVGFRLGKSRHRKKPGTDGGDIALTSMYALLGLVLAFTYSFTVARSDQRKKSVVEEANALGTAFLRADFANQPERRELQLALRDYAATRIFEREMVATDDLIHRTIQQTREAQKKIWPATVKIIASSSRTPIEASLVAAVNDVLDMHTRRIAAAFDRLPMVALYMLMFVACGSMAVAGYNRGMAGDINRTRMTVVALVLATVIAVITDFDRPYSGFVQESQESLLEVLRDMDATLSVDSTVTPRQ